MSDVAGGLTGQPSIIVTNITASGGISASNNSSIIASSFEADSVQVAAYHPTNILQRVLKK